MKPKHHDDSNTGGVEGPKDCQKNESQSGPQDTFARTVAFVGVIIGILSCVFAGLTYLSSQKQANQSRLLEARTLVEGAIDLMGKNDPGTKVITAPFRQPSIQERRQLELARRRIEKALSLAPEFYAAHIAYGIYLESIGSFDDALKRYRRSIELAPKEGWAWNDLGNLLRRLGRGNEAKDAFKKAVDLDPGNPYFHHNLGLQYYDMEQYENASRQFEVAKECAGPHGIELGFPKERNKKAKKNEGK
jgi:tetratricopeptide (TPR) repeat protein